MARKQTLIVYPHLNDCNGDLSKKWSVEGNRMKSTSAEAKATNSYLDAHKAKIHDYQQQLIREDELVNAENIRNKILAVEKRSHNAYWHFSTA